MPAPRSLAEVALESGVEPKVAADFAGLLSLGWWGWFAGMKADVSIARRTWFAVSYTVMGMIVIGVELVLTH